MKERALRRRCKRELQSLQVQPPLDVETLCRLLGERRGRPIRLVPYGLPVSGPSGLWIGTDSADYIFHQRETSKAHQDHIIMHEVGHILAGHSNREADGGVLQALMPNISPDVVKSMLGRTSYDEEQEREAELIATIIMGWAMLEETRPRPSGDRATRRIQAALGDRQGWL